jgi:hypothetical protein
LWILLLLQAKALGRRVTRGARSVKGGLFLLVGILVFGLWLWPSILTATAMPRTDPDAVRAVAPVALLAATLLTVLSAGGERAIVFTPAEVVFLFPGPFTRRQVLLYRILKSSAGATFSAIILSVVFLRHASSWLAAVLAMVLGMLFLQYLGIVLLLAAQTIGERAHTWGRRIIVLAIVLAVAVPVLPLFWRGMAGGGVVALAKLVRASPVGRVVLLPVEPFGYLLTARRLFPDLVMWAAVVVAIDAALLWVIFWLDADFLESAAARSAVVQEKIARARKMGIGAPVARGTVKFSPPMLPRLGGVGPVMWRQVTAAVRGSKGLLFVLILVAAVAGPAVYGARDSGAANSQALVGTMAGALAWVTVVVGGMIKFDFRGDVDHMEVLKSLPLSGWAVCAGEIAVPVVMLTVFHWLVLGAVMIAKGGLGPILGIAAVLSLPFNALVFLVENLGFLIYPVRGPQGAMDFQNFGRQTLFFLVKMIVVLVAGGLAAGAGAVAWMLTHWWPAVGTAALVVLCGVAAGLMPVLVWAYGRYDVSVDTPAG